MAPPMNCEYFLLLTLLVVGTNSRQILNYPDTSRPNLGTQSFDDELKLIFSTIPSTPAPMQVDDFNSGTLRPTGTLERVTQTSGGRVRWSYKNCGIGKKCVPSYLCPLGSIIDDGSSVIDLRFGPDESCPRLEICCSVDDINDISSMCPEKTETGCGYRNVGGIGYKASETSSEAQFGEFPWMMAILHRNDPSNPQAIAYKCGGSLLTPNVVLTGAHCIQDGPADSYIVRAGEWEPGSDKEVCPDQSRDVLEVISHEEFNNKNLFNDVALLFVDAPFDLAPNVNTVCLPPPDFDFDYSNCYASGWGKDKFRNGRYSNILKKIDLPVVPNAQCQTSLRDTRLGKYFRLHSSLMCAGGELGRDMCKGDGGSPLVCPISNSPNRFYQAGIVAWGIGCGEENVPGVYTRVPRFRAWIDKQLASKNIDQSFYTP